MPGLTAHLVDKETEAQRSGSFLNSQITRVMTTPYEWGSFLTEGLHNLPKVLHSPIGADSSFELYPLDTKASPRRVRGP